MATTKEIQSALISKGYDVGSAGADGIRGRDTTNAIKKFQKDKGLSVDGIVGPQTISALFNNSPPAAKTAIKDDVPWFNELARKKGLRETDPKLKAWLKSDNHTLGDPSELPWCGDAVETSIALALPDEPMIVNPYWARNWLKFGVPLQTPTTGAILVFERGPNSGHVGFYVGEDSSRYHVLGGNQSNAVTVCGIEKGRLLGIRWPKTAPLPLGGRVTRNAGDVTLSTNEA